MKKICFPLSAVVFWALVITGCGGSGSVFPPPPENVSGPVADFGEPDFSPAFHGGWHTEVVDAPPAVDHNSSIEARGGASSVPPDIWISYYILGANDLKEARRAIGGPWTLFTRDATAGDAGRWNSLELSDSQSPVIAYRHSGAKTRAWNGAIRSVDPTNDLGVFTDLVRKPGSTEYHTVYTGQAVTPGASFSQVRHARSFNGGTTWTSDIVESVPAHLGSFSFTSIAYNPLTGQYHIAYRGTTGRLRHAYGNTGAWTIEDVLPASQDTANIGQTTTLISDRGEVHIIYNRPGEGLYHAEKIGSLWTTELIAKGHGIMTPDAAVKCDGVTHVSAYGSTPKDLIHFWKQGGIWNAETVSSAGDIGQFASISADEVCCLHISAKLAGPNDLMYHTNWTPEGCFICDDDDLCTEDVIIDGVCQHIPKNCDDGNDCTTDFCDPATGNCVNDPLCRSHADCDDGNACTEEVCVDGCCRYEPECEEDADCDDDNDCTEDFCFWYCCVNDPECIFDQDCDDGNECTEDYCDFFGCCHNDPECTSDFDCFDGDLCTTDWCDENGCCQRENKVCDDENPCTEDSCDAATGDCVHNPQCTSDEDCFDGDLCTTDWCDSLGCCHNDPVVCDDDNPCTEDSCDAATGACVHNPQCTSDEDCPDPDPEDKCVIALCNEEIGCCESAIKTCGTACCDADADCPDDGNICTAEYCADGCCARRNVFDDPRCFPDGGTYCHPTRSFGVFIDWNDPGIPDTWCFASYPAGARPDTWISRNTPDPNQPMPREIPTEILGMNLMGNSCIIRESPTRASTGKDKSNPPPPPNSDYRISSFFDVFTEIEILDRHPPNTYHNKDPMRISGVVNQWGDPQNYSGGGTPVNLYDEYNNIVGLILELFLFLDAGFMCLS